MNDRFRSLSTYRVQLTREFGFEAAGELIPFLHRLGIGALYSSPIQQARSGSTHGYDGTDPTRLNPELGGETGMRRLAADLKAAGMGWILDIVPNHLAASFDNPWWREVLEIGRSSPHAAVFDIAWEDGSISGGPPILLLPVLEEPFGRTLEDGLLRLEVADDGIAVGYFDQRFPVYPGSWRRLFGFAGGSTGRRDRPPGWNGRRFIGLRDRIEAIPPVVPDHAQADLANRCRDIHRRFRAALQAEPGLGRRFESVVRRYGGRKEGEEKDRLEALLRDQTYRLVHWQFAGERMSYRRFFDIHHLVGIRIEDPEVFRITHDLILRLVGEGAITGLRIDHIDGMRDPEEYLRRLRVALDGSGSGRPVRIFVEKILTGEERLPAEWPVTGTTGYDFLRVGDRLFVDPVGFAQLRAIYRRFGAVRSDFSQTGDQAKKAIMTRLFGAELARLTERLRRLAAGDRHGLDLPAAELRDALIETTAAMPVYRTYIRRPPVPPRDARWIETAFETARRRFPRGRQRGLDFLRRVLLLQFPEDLPETDRREWVSLVADWQQFSGPIMAKGIEDTAFYRYVPLLSLNEVGGGPVRGESPVELFHLRNQWVREHCPGTMNATTTHDTKRGEDFRLRLHVLSEMPREWDEKLRRWRRWNLAHKTRVNGREAPDPNEEIHVYQTLLGAWPNRKTEMRGLPARIRRYFVKAAREAKIHTSWTEPDPEYEKALGAFVRGLLAGGRNPFLNDFRRFQARVAWYGAFYSIALVVLKATSPGVPDFYQGSELWDLNLVDPDNRRPVDFDRRIRMLDRLAETGEGIPESCGRLLTDPLDPAIKLFVTRIVLGFRREHADLFLRGDYLPLQAPGRMKNDLCAFARRRNGDWAMVVVPLRLVGRVRAGRLPLGRHLWGDAVLELPEDAPRVWRDRFTGLEVRPAGERRSGRSNGILLREVLAEFPVALLQGAASPEGDPIRESSE